MIKSCSFMFVLSVVSPQPRKARGIFWTPPLALLNRMTHFCCTEVASLSGGKTGYLVSLGRFPDWKLLLLPIELSWRLLFIRRVLACFTSASVFSVIGKSLGPTFAPLDPPPAPLANALKLVERTFVDAPPSFWEPEDSPVDVLDPPPGIKDWLCSRFGLRKLWLMLVEAPLAI